MDGRTLILTKDPKGKKRFMVVLPAYLNFKPKTIRFGGPKKPAYIDDGNELRKEIFLKNRTATHLDIRTPTFWQRWVMYNFNDIERNIKYIEEAFNIKINYIPN